MNRYIKILSIIFSSLSIGLCYSMEKRDILQLPIYLKNSAGRKNLIIEIKQKDRSSVPRIAVQNELIYLGTFKDIEQISYDTYGKLEELKKFVKLPYLQLVVTAENIKFGDRLKKDFLQNFNDFNHPIGVIEITAQDFLGKLDPVSKTYASSYLLENAKTLIPLLKTENMFPESNVFAFFKFLYEWLGSNPQKETLIFPAFTSRGQHWLQWFNPREMIDFNLDAKRQQSAMKQVQTTPPTDWKSITEKRRLVALYLLGLPNPAAHQINPEDINAAHQALRTYWQDLERIAGQKGEVTGYFASNINGILTLIDNARDYLTIFGVK